MCFPLGQSWYLLVQHCSVGGGNVASEGYGFKWLHTAQPQLSEQVQVEFRIMRWSDKDLIKTLKLKICFFLIMAEEWISPSPKQISSDKIIMIDLYYQPHLLPIQQSFEVSEAKRIEEKPANSESLLNYSRSIWCMSKREVKNVWCILPSRQILSWGKIFHHAENMKHIEVICSSPWKQKECMLCFLWTEQCFEIGVCTSLSNRGLPNVAWNQKISGLLIYSLFDYFLIFGAFGKVQFLLVGELEIPTVLL
jgi:hypothetical protein